MRSQKEYYEKHLALFPDNKLVGVYVETASELRRKKRLQFEKLIRDCKRGKIDIIITKSISRFASGESKLANRVCYGYTKDKDGNLIIDEEKAKNAKLIFELYLQGNSISKISKELKKRGILSPTGKETWANMAIDKLLSNEKYIGNAFLQKTYVADIFEQKQTKNNGEVTRYLYENNHVGIIEKELFDAVQEEKQRKSKGQVLQDIYIK